MHNAELPPGQSCHSSGRLRLHAWGKITLVHWINIWHLYSYFVHFLDSNKGVKSCDNINIGSTLDANEIILLVSELVAFETAKPVLYSTILSTGGATKWVKAIPSELETNSFWEQNVEDFFTKNQNFAFLQNFGKEIHFWNVFGGL